MSLLDKIAAAVTPTASEEDRAKARRDALSLAGQNDWLAMALDHHQQIERCFDRAFAAVDARGRRSALKELELILTGHANAEESVLYPALADEGEKGHATMAYEEQAMTKIQLAKLEKIDPMSDEWGEKLEHIEGAVLQHIYQEEHSWFPDLVRKTPTGEQSMLTQRFKEEFDRYVGAHALTG